MNRKINWVGYFDEIDLVYEKAEKNEAAAELLETFETQALNEAKENVELIKREGKVIFTSEQFDTLSDKDKEFVIGTLADAGLNKVNVDVMPPKFTFVLDSFASRVMSCVFFSIINRIEKLDGTINNFTPKVDMEILIPNSIPSKLLIKGQVLVLKLYPWMNIRVSKIEE